MKVWGDYGERAEREPITGVWEQSPQRGPGAPGAESTPSGFLNLITACVRNENGCVL